MSGLLEKHSSSQEAVILACKAVPLYGLSLPSHPPLIMRQLLSSVLSALSLHASKRCLEVIGPGMKLLITVLGLYPAQLHDICNVTQLAYIMSAGIEPDSLADKEILIQIAQNCAILVNDTQFLSNADKDTLTREGVCYGLSSMLAAFHDNMPPQAIKEVTIAVMVLSNLSPSGGLFVNETFYTSLLFVAREHTANPGLQQIIWKALVLRCQKDSGFVSQLMAMDVLSVVVGVLSQDTSHVVLVTSLLSFLTLCCHWAPGSFIPLCLDRPTLMQHLVAITEAKESILPVPFFRAICSFMASLYNKCQPEHYHSLARLDLVGKIQDCAIRLPGECLHQAITVSEAALAHRPVDDRAFHTCLTFVIDVLSTLNTRVLSYDQSIDMACLTLLKILKLSSLELLAKLRERAFVELFVDSFVHITHAYPGHVTFMVTVAAQVFVSQLNTKEPVELLREFKFHTAVTNFISVTENVKVLTTAVWLLAMLIGRYQKFLEDLKPFLSAQLPDILLDKLSQNAHQHGTQLSNKFAYTMYTLIADKDVSLELLSSGFLERFISLLQTTKQYDVTIIEGILSGIEDSAYESVDAKKLLIERNVHSHLVPILEAKTKENNTSLICACCRVLYVLSWGDIENRSLAENGCTEILLQVLRTCKDNAEIRSVSLGVLSSIAEVAVVNRRYILTPKLLKVVVGILEECTNATVISYALLVLLVSVDLDESLAMLRQLNVEESIRAAIDNAEYVKQSVHLAQWGSNILENLCLFTVRAQPESLAALPQPAAHSTQDWPPVINISVSLPRRHLHLSPSSTSKQLLLPLEDVYMQPHFPTAVDLTDSARKQLSQLGLHPDKPLFRVGRVYGSTFWLCRNCKEKQPAEELVIRLQSMTPDQYQELVDRGWYRRGGVELYRFQNNHNVCCCNWEARVLVHDFDHRTHKSYRKVLRRMAKERLTVETLPTHFNRDAFDLYNEYNIQQHGKTAKSEYSYCEHVVDSPVAECTGGGVKYGTFHQLYRLDGKLVAISIIDIVPSGIISIYMCYSMTKEVRRLSFGVYSMLKEIQLVCNLSKNNPNMRYYYVQGWNRNNRKLAYKANYEPEEFYCPGIAQDWVPSLEGVKRAQEVCNARHTKAEAEQRDAEEEGINGGEKDGSRLTAHCSDISNAGKREPAADSSETGESAALSTSEQRMVETGSLSENATSVSCSAFPNDLQKYCEQTGLDSITVEGIIVCLNLSHYVRFGEISNFCDISPSQYEIMSKRFSELIAAIGPNLASHLIIDLKACPCPSSLSLGESGCSVSATSPGSILAEI